MDNSDFNKTSQKDLVSTSFKFQSLICSACCNYFDRNEQSIITASPGDKRHCLPILRSSFGYQLSPVCQRPLLTEWIKITVVQVCNWDRKQSKRSIICGIFESVSSSCSTFCFISSLHPKKTSVYQLFSFALETSMFETQLKKKINDLVGNDAKSTSVPKYSFAYARYLSGTFKELRGNEWNSGRVSTSHHFNCLVIN